MAGQARHAASGRADPASAKRVWDSPALPLGDTSAAATQRVVRKLVLPGVEVLEQRFHWEAGDTMSVAYEKIELHCRLEPYTLQVRIWVEPGQEYPLGRVSLLPGGRRFHGRAGTKSEDVRTICCRFDRSWLARQIGTDLDWDAIDPATLLDFQHSHIERALRRLAEEVVSQGEHSKAMGKLLCQSIVIDLARFFARAEPQAKLARDQMTRIKDLLSMAEGPLPSASDIADELGLSLGHLRRLFRNTNGQTLHAFIEDARFAKASALLIETNLPLKVVSFLTGFGQHSTFSYAFKRKFGQSPKDYRRQLQ